jgi:hypothetical protein
VVTDTPVAAKANLSTARFSMNHPAPLFDALDRQVEFESGTFSIQGNVASVSLICRDEKHLERWLDTLFFVLPSILARYIPDVPYSTHAWGLLDDIPFRVQYESTDVVASTTVTSKAHQEDMVTEAWVLTLMAASNVRLRAGCEYFHAACRLLDAGCNRFEFTAEAILNFAKCLQALCGDTRDDARKNLRALGYNSGDLDGRFIPALVLRDQFDVAHIALSRLTRDELRVLHDYADIAEAAFRDLVARVLTEVQGGRYEVPETELGGLSRDKRRNLRRLAESMDLFRAR